MTKSTAQSKGPTGAPLAKPGKPTSAAPLRVRRPAPAHEPIAPLYKVLQQSFIDNVLVGPGTQHPTVTYYGVPGKDLQPLNAAAKANKNAASDIRRQYPGADNAEARAAALRELDNDLQRIDLTDEEADYEEAPLTDAEREELQRQADGQGQGSTGVTLTGDPADPDGSIAAAAASAKLAADAAK